MIYGDFGNRFLAYIIDYLIIAIPLSFIWYFLSMPIPEPNFQFYVFVFFLNPIGWISGILYYGIMESGSKQATYGKQVMNLKVAGTNGEPLTFRRAAARTLNKFFSSFFLLGFLMFFLNKKNQTFHDWLTNSVVIQRAS
ncbi:RDD family protein [Robiginitalea sp. IMCC43444]|uniref:RDD family protein n=1 Tax=Robiginitalea sp. IMCC43444 TaxID=3459121 RepID=UPI0040419631